MADFKEFDVVKVVKLLHADRRFDGTENVKRSPLVGDQGTIVHLAEDFRQCVVECVDPDGVTVWLAEFDFGELEAISS